jgi:hypothetical protein
MAALKGLRIERRTRTNMRLRRCLALLTCIPALLAGSVGMATAEPDNGRTVTYEFTDCTSGSDFEAVKQLGQAAALHLAGGPGNFVAMKAVVLGDQTIDGTFYADGTVLFETPGFSGQNGLPTITCTNTSPTSGITSRVTGYIAPPK